MDELDFFDAHCWAGVPMNGGLVTVPDAESLLRAMDRVGISRAVVAHRNAIPAGSVCCNQELSDFLKNDRTGRLFGCWSILPDCCCDVAHKSDRLAEAMKKDRIVMLEVFPNNHHFLMHPRTMGTTMALCASARIPVKLAVHELGWQAIYQIIDTYPENRFIVSGTELWGCDHYTRPLLATSENVYVEISEYWVAGGLADWVKEYGSSRLLYGSGYPVMTHGSQMLNIRHSTISFADKSAIASGNLQRLLAEVTL